MTCMSRSSGDELNVLANAYTLNKIGRDTEGCIPRSGIGRPGHPNARRPSTWRHKKVMLDRFTHAKLAAAAMPLR